VRVLVLRASLEDRKIDFRLTGHLGEPVAEGGRGPQRAAPARGKQRR